MKKKIIVLIIALIVEAGLILTVCGINGVLTKTLSSQEIVRYVCDGFCTAGAIYLCVGGLVWASNKGAFDGLGYQASLRWNSFIKNKRNWQKKEEYSEYVERQTEKRAGRNINFFAIIGGISILVSSILLLVYYFAF